MVQLESHFSYLKSYKGQTEKNPVYFLTKSILFFYCNNFKEVLSEKLEMFIKHLLRQLLYVIQ